MVFREVEIFKDPFIVEETVCNGDCSQTAIMQPLAVYYNSDTEYAKSHTMVMAVLQHFKMSEPVAFETNKKFKMC